VGIFQIGEVRLWLRKGTVWGKNKTLDKRKSVEWSAENYRSAMGTIIFRKLNDRFSFVEGFF